MTLLSFNPRIGIVKTHWRQKVRGPIDAALGKKSIKRIIGLDHFTSAGRKVAEQFSVRRAQLNIIHIRNAFAPTHGDWNRIDRQDSTDDAPFLTSGSPVYSTLSHEILAAFAISELFGDAHEKAVINVLNLLVSEPEQHECFTRQGFWEFSIRNRQEATNILAVVNDLLTGHNLTSAAHEIIKANMISLQARLEEYLAKFR